MSKNDYEPYSDRDLDRNDELLHPIRKKQDKSNPVADKDRIDRIQECLAEGAHVKDHVDTHKIDRQLTAAQRLASPIEVASFFDAGPSTSRDNATSANELPLNNIGQTLKRQSTAVIEYDKDSKQREYDLPDVNPQQTLGLDGNEKYAASDSNQSLHGNIYQSKLTMPLSKYAAQGDHGSSREMKMEAAVQFVDLTSTPYVGRIQRGLVYQNQMLLLFLYRGLRNGYTFQIAKDVDGVGRFDDLSFQYEDKTNGEIVHRFLQVKLAFDESKVISVRDLCTVRSGGFSLQEYFRSFREMNKNLGRHKDLVKDCILWTNIGFNFEELSRKKIYVLPVTDRDGFLDFETTSKQSARYKLRIDPSSRVYEILRETSDDGDSEKIVEFFDKLIFAVNQPNDVELKGIITRELAAESQFEPHAELVYNSLLQDVVNGLKNNGKFLSQDDGKAIFHSVEGKLNSIVCSRLSSSYLAEISQYDVEFKDEIQKLIEFLIPNPDHKANQSVLNLIAAEETLLTIIRVYQTIRKIQIYPANSQVFVTLETLQRPGNEQTVVRAFQPPQSPTLLVVECGSANREDLQRLCDKLREPIEKNCAKKLILITKCADIQSINHVEVCVEEREEVSFNNLTEASQQKLLDRPVFNFQGEMGMSLRKLLENHNSDKIKSSKSTDFGSVIDSSTLIKLIRSEKMKVGDGLKELGEVVDPYRYRKCQHQVFLGQDILECQFESEVFAISGINLTELEGLVIDREKIQSFGEIDRRTIHLYKFVILDNERDRQQFRTLCAKYLSDGYNVHWLKSESKKLIWKESHGDITNLLKYREVDKSTVRFLMEDQLAAKSEGNDIVIISDDAGMGKTTMFRFLAKKIKANTSGLWVINIDRNSFKKVQQDELSYQNFDGSDIGQAIEFFVEKLLNLKTDLEKKVLTIIMKNHGRVALLFDGFDEIHPNYRETVIQLLQTFKKHGIEKVFVSTRPHTTEELEKRLRVFHYTMIPFSEEDQTNFLIKFWQSKLDLRGDENRVKEYVEALIKMVRKSIRDLANEFSGIPLQTRMIAEAFLHNTYGGMRDFETCKEFLQSGRCKPKLPTKMRIVDLYKHFVDQKYHIYYTEKVRANFIIGNLYKSGLSQIFLKTHQKLALYSLFNIEEVNILLSRQGMESLLEQTKKIAEDNDETGLISYISNDKPQFIHQSFAEYFAAIFMVKKLKKVDHNPAVQKFIVDQILLQPQYHVIRAFLNGLLENSSFCDDQYGDEAYANGSWKSVLVEGCGSRNQTIFHVAVKEHNDEIVKFFLPRFGNKNEISGFLDKFVDESGETALYAAATGQHWKQLKLLVESGGADVKCWNCNRETPLHRAAFSGSLTMVEWLVENGADLRAKSIENHTPLHSAARAGKLEVLEWLINKTEIPVILLLHDTGISEAPLTVFQWFVEEKDASHEARDDTGESLIYKAVSWGRADVVEWLVTDKGVTLEHEADGGTNLIRLAVDGNHWNIIKCLLKSRVFNLVVENAIGSAVLKCAIGGAPLNDIEWLVDHNGIDVNAKIMNEDTLVYYCVAHGRLDIVQWLVNKKEVDLTTTDATGGTVLHKAAAGGSLDMIQFLIQTGKVDVFHIDNDNRKALDVYIEYHAPNRNLRIVQLLYQNSQ